LLRSEPTSPIKLYPLEKTERTVLRKHTKTVDHETGDVLFDGLPCLSVSLRALCRPCLCDKAVHEHLIEGIVQMAVEHGALRLSLRGQPILPVVTKDRVVREYHLSSLVVNLRIVLNPVKAAAVGRMRVILPANPILKRKRQAAKCWQAR